MMSNYYVSEFTVFINQYLEQHPEVVDQRQRGWNDDWQPHRFDAAALRETAEDSVADDTYGFNWVVRHDTADTLKPH
jgi:hypothetical protein